MQIDMVCFTKNGHSLGERLRGRLCARGDQTSLERCGSAGRPLKDWVREFFDKTDALIFIGAVGIAVRAIAASITIKTNDPAVVVIDDSGRFAVALLSGHIGGANELANTIAEFIGATPVITTATDCAGLFAVDSWARRKKMLLRNPEAIKTVSGKLLSGETVKVFCGFPVVSPLPDGLELSDGMVDLLIDFRLGAFPHALHVVPTIATLGIGCRKGTTAEAIAAAIDSFCAFTNIAPEAIGRVTSIDLKKDESGLVAFCAARGLQFVTYSAETLAAVTGEFTASKFVESATGVDNVCERSAVAEGQKRLLLRKTVINGIALAMAIQDYTVDFGNGDGKDR